MLDAYPTKRGTGISIFGDYADLLTLYELVHKIAAPLDEDSKVPKGQHQLLMNFAYEIRKAYEGSRLKEETSFSTNSEPVFYYGFQLVWTDILLFIAAVRRNVGFTQSDKMEQGMLYLLEYVTEKALFAYDPEGAVMIKDFIGQRINVSQPFIFNIYQTMHVRFVSEPTGKRRFRKIPEYLTNFLNPKTGQYQMMIASYAESAKMNNCAIEDLEYKDFPEIKW